jgi:putative transcriptional regulator
MAVTRMTLAQARAIEGMVDRAKLDATTEDDIRRHVIEDGEEPDAPVPPGRMVVLAGSVRRQLGMTQPQFAKLIGVPLGTLRNWEQGHGMPDAPVRALFIILSREPEAALRALRAA